MSKIRVTFECEEDINKLLEKIEQHIDMKNDSEEAKNLIRGLLQEAFDEGRKFQKFSCSNLPKECLMAKSDI